MKILPSYDERLRRARARGLEDDDPNLPLRVLTVHVKDGAAFIGYGPIDYGMPEVKLYEVEFRLRLGLGPRRVES